MLSNKKQEDPKEASHQLNQQQGTEAECQHSFSPEDGEDSETEEANQKHIHRMGGDSEQPMPHMSRVRTWQVECFNFSRSSPLKPTR